MRFTSTRSLMTVAAVAATTLAVGVWGSPAVASPRTSAPSAPSAVSGTAGVGHRDHVLVVDQGDVRSDWVALVRNMRGSGFHLDYTRSLPSDLTAYGQVWWVGCSAQLGPTGESQLVEFDRAGGSLLLTAENSNCRNANTTTKKVADPLIATLGPNGLVYGPSGLAAGSVNSHALHLAASTPRVLTGFQPNNPGSIDMTGLPRRNVLVWARTSRAAMITVWDRSDLVGEVGGRIVIVTDINWTRATNGTAIATNLATFLQGVAR